MNEEVLSRINQLERQILIHSYIYYEKDDSIWTDNFYDAHCRELADLLNRYPTEASFAEWSSAFNGYDPSTGFGLPYNNPWVVMKAEYLYKLNKDNKHRNEATTEPNRVIKVVDNINTQDKKNKPAKGNPKQGKLF